MKVLYQCEICEAIFPAEAKEMAEICENQQTTKPKYKAGDTVKCGGIEVRILSVKFGVFDHHSPQYCYRHLTAEGNEIGPINGPASEMWFS